jgi:uncharacterized protein (DUF1800 family)
MRSVFVAIVIGCCFCGSALAISQDEAQRLSLRTGFAPTAVQASEVAYALVVDRWIDEAAARRSASTPPPDWVTDPLPMPGAVKQMSAEEKKDYQRRLVRQGLALQSWWMQEMLTTPAPLTERMTLFWHGHFTSSFKGVRAAQLLYRQNVLLRENALGNYRELLHAVARDPAMLLYLNNQQNRKGEPNENFARELLELFTLGEGHYSERDIKEAARAFTGWKMLPPEGRFVEVARQHDEGTKTFLGHTGNYDGDDIIDLILQQPRAAEFIVEKLWREFVSPQPDRAAVQRLTAGFRKNWEIAPLMKALLREPAFLSARNDALLVKSPVEFVVGTVRALDLPVSPLSAALAADQMGQSLFNPPNVKGWPGGDAWITSEWLLARRQFVLQLAGDMPPSMAMGENQAARLHKLADREIRKNSAEVQRRFGEAAEALPPQNSERLLLAMAPLTPPVAGAKPPDRLEDWLLDPVYNLK